MKQEVFRQTSGQMTSWSFVNPDFIPPVKSKSLQKNLCSGVRQQTIISRTDTRKQQRHWTSLHLPYKSWGICSNDYIETAHLSWTFFGPRAGYILVRWWSYRAHQRRLRGCQMRSDCRATTISTIFSSCSWRKSISSCRVLECPPTVGPILSADRKMLCPRYFGTVLIPVCERTKNN